MEKRKGGERDKGRRKRGKVVLKKEETKGRIDLKRGRNERERKKVEKERERRRE